MASNGPAPRTKTTAPNETTKIALHNETELYVVANGINARVWGPPMWDMMMFVALTADENRSDGEMSKWCEKWFMLQTACLPCGPCRRYYTECFVRFVVERRHSSMSWVRWLCSIHNVIEAKIRRVAPASNKSHYNMLHRMHVNGDTPLSATQVCSQFMLQAFRLQIAKMGTGGVAVHRDTRALYRSILLFCHIAQTARPRLSRALQTAVASMQHLTDGKVPEPDELLALLMIAQRSLGETRPFSTHERLSRIQTALLGTADFVSTHYLGIDCI